MKVAIILLGLALCLSITPLKIGNECFSIKGFSTTNFTVTYSTLCVPFSVNWTGRFTDAYSTKQLFVTETLNNTSSYSFMINTTGNYDDDQMASFVFTVNPFRCLPGDYSNKYQLLGNQGPIGCWEFGYNIS